MIFSRDFLRVFVPLAICFAIYQLTFVPWINTKNFQSERRWTTVVLPETNDWWNKYFREDSWQRQSPQVLVTELGTFLYKNKVELSETRWKIEPLTVLIPQRGSGSNQRAILISNPMGAEIQFQKTPDWTTEAPPIENGRMVGDILIYSPPDENSNDSGLKIDTSDVRIEKRQIYTYMPITMEMGNSLLKGRFLTINLAQKILGAAPPAGVKSPFQGLDNLELNYVDQVEIGLKDGGLWPSKEDPQALTRKAKATLECQGRFTFNFAQSEAILRGNVRMHHRVDGLPPDQFECEELRLQIGMYQDPAIVSDSVTPDGGKKSPWRVEKLTAVGALGSTPADRSRWLKLTAPGMKLDAHGQRLFVDLMEGEVNLSNSLPMTAIPETTRVYLRHDDMEIWSPDIHFRNPELFSQLNSDDSSARKFNRLGTVLAAGPGVAQMGGEKETWKLSWGQKLLIQPSENLDVVSILGSANLNHSTHGSFVANKLNVWLKPLDAPTHTLLAGYYPNDQVPEWLPEAINADGDVRVESPQLHARVDSMNVRFAYPDKPASAAQRAVLATANSNNSQTTAGSAPAPIDPNNLAGAQTGPNAAGPNATGLVDVPNLMGAESIQNTFGGNIVRQPHSLPPGPSTTLLSPYQVEAKTLTASVFIEGKQNTMQSLALDGNFKMQRSMLTETTPWPMTANGVQLRLQEIAPEQFNMHLIGQPAKVTLGSGEVQAPELQLSQSNQLFHIDHPGVFVIPTELLESQSGQNSNTNSLTYQPPLPMTLAGPGNFGSTPGNQLKWIEPPRIQWGSNMTFDGRTARFGGGVNLTARMQSSPDGVTHLHAQSNSLAVDLVNPIPLSASKKNKSPKAEINQIRLEENVEIKTAQTDLNNQRLSTEHIKLPRLDIHLITQTFLGYGPGELWTRRFASSPAIPNLDSNKSPTSTGNGLMPISTTNAPTEQLQCLHLSFLGRLEGNLKTKQASFYDRIEALMGPIRSWDDEVNVRFSERLSPGQTNLISDQINIFDASSLSYNQNPRNPMANAVAWEIEALSRVRIESMTDSGRIVGEGHAMKYGARDDSAHIAGSPSQNAVMTFYRNNEEPQTMILSNISVQLKTGAIRGNINRVEGVLPSEYQRAGVVPQNTTSQPPPQSGNSLIGTPSSPGIILPSARDRQN